MTSRARGRGALTLVHDSSLEATPATAPAPAPDHWQLDGFVASLSSSSPHTVSAYRSDLRDFTSWAHRGGIVDPATIGRIHLRRYVAYLNTRRYAKRTVARKVAALRRYFRWLCRTGGIQADPSASLRAPTDDQGPPRLVRAAELAAALDGPTSGGEPRWRRCRDDAVLELLYGSGLRVSELCELDIGHVDLVHRSAAVDSRGSKNRHVPISGRALEALHAWFAVRDQVVERDDSQALFDDNHGQRLCARDVRRIIDRRSASPARPRALQNSFATNPAHVGADLQSVHEFHGQADVATTQRYTHVSNERLRSVYAETHPRA